MARLLSTSPAIVAPKTANVYIPIETPQKSVATTAYLSQTRPRDLEVVPPPGGSLRGTGPGTYEALDAAGEVYTPPAPAP